VPVPLGIVALASVELPYGADCAALDISAPTDIPVEIAVTEGGEVPNDTALTPVPIVLVTV